ncbi:HlyD family secretion protein [Prevotella sp. OH937_COT-195]|uniref:HlyD family secretion protein n=1 Tax=Prevotella sp. OH937_COT-195 TaxID=2491051 RepID=UPI000F64A2FF|nr:HlyD family efflux transporter periplasmic adaptor subunit [Prevotella sp. OH937_COT-195]RRD02909.1 HlyD family efflux transporter periplasmic adaptor subunit [Prevotella sp. OH937_COT-195]
MRKFFLLLTTVMAAACSSGNKEYDATGTFEATEIMVSAEQSGRLMTFDITEGDFLERDRQAGVIDTVQLTLKARQLGANRESIANQRPDMRKQVAATRRQIAEAEREVARFGHLVKDDAANRKQLEDAQSRLDVLRKQLEAQKSSLGNIARSIDSQVGAAEIQRLQVLDQLRKCYITTPIAGTVLEKYAEQGEFVTVGKPLFKIADTQNMYLRAYITSVKLSRVKIGQNVKVFSDYGGGTKHEYDGVVTWISSRSEFTPKNILTDDERADQVYAVKIRVKNDGYVKIGMYGEVRF